MYTLEENDTKAKRFRMVSDQVEARGIDKKEVLAALRKVPRHLFVSGPEESKAYDDCPLPIGYGQTLSQPYMVGTVTSLLELAPQHRVLEIGAGSGYQTAILSCLVKEVIGLEYHSDLANRAAAVLNELELDNVKIFHADGKLGWREGAPYDRILASCAVSQVPAAWLDQLKNQGYLVFPEVRGQDQVLVRWQKGSGPFWEKKEDFFSVRYVPLL